MAIDRPFSSPLAAESIHSEPIDSQSVCSASIDSAINQPSADSQASPAVPEIDAHTLHHWLNDRSLTLVDVREPAEFEAGSIPGAILRPLGELDAAELARWPGRLVLYCRSGRRSAIAGQRILSHGAIDLVHLQGGILAWTAAGYSTVISDDTDSIKTHSTTLEGSA